jgi:hypothetical protein
MEFHFIGILLACLEVYDLFMQDKISYIVQQTIDNSKVHN